MLLSKTWDFFVETATAFFLPLVCAYYSLSSDLFFNAAYEEATGLERIGNVLLVPSQYIFAGRSASRDAAGELVFHPRFNYEQDFAIKSIACSLSAIPSFIIGSAVKALSLLGEESRKHQKDMQLALYTKPPRHCPSQYLALGIDLGQGELEWSIPEGYTRKSGDENHLSVEKEALLDIAKVLNEAGIPWWADCGTCLGAYRYGGVIPWDEDIDIAVLLPDFSDVLRALHQLDPHKYIVQDWSSRSFPHSYLKVFIRKSKTLVDVYHFSIDASTRKISYIFSLEKALLFPEWWKIREKRFKVPVSFDDVFPLKKALFDGIEVYVPRQTKTYLQRCYGENLAPAKIFSPITGTYENDLSHPYWQRSYVH